MKAVIYARYSSAGQRDVSIEDQVREIKSYASSHNYEIITEYADKAKSGRNADKRAEFLRMIRDAEKHSFQCVLVYKHDRFARNQYDAVIYKKKLKDNGVKVIAVTEPIPDGHGAMILESIYQAMAEEYSENLSQNIKRGQKGNALKCYANHKAPFGYIINHDTHRYDIDAENAPFVQRIFDMVLQGRPHKDILKYLEEHGKPHSKNWLYQVLHNERYTGVYIYGDTRTEDGMPKLVSKTDFAKVQEIMKQRQQKPQLKPYHYLFSGKIYCGYCQSLMNGESATSHTGVTYRYYCCPKAKKLKKCHKQRISAQFIETKAVEALKDVIFTEEIIEKLADDMEKLLSANRSEYLTELKSKLNDVTKRINNIQSNIECSPHVPESLLARMCDLDKQKNELQSAIRTEQLVSQSIDIRKEDLKDFIRNFDKEKPKLLVNTFVTRISVYDDYAILEYDASGDNEIRIDFCAASTMVEQNGIMYKISKGRIYIKVKLKSA